MQLETWSPVLATLTRRDMDRLAASSVTREVRRGVFLTVAGEVPEQVHLIDSGLVKLMAADVKGGETVVGLVGEGELVGEMAALEDEPHGSDAVAVASARVTTFDASTFVQVVMGSRRALHELTLSVCRRNRSLTRSALEKAVAPVPERLAGSLLDLAEVLGRWKEGAIEMELPFGQTDLGDLAGMCRETACKGLGRLRAAGLVDYEGRRMRILRPHLLERMRCGDGSGGQRVGSGGRNGSWGAGKRGRRG